MYKIGLFLIFLKSNLNYSIRGKAGDFGAGAFGVGSFGVGAFGAGAMEPEPEPPRESVLASAPQTKKKHKNKMTRNNVSFHHVLYTVSGEGE
jgi:hypothetical protein